MYVFNFTTRYSTQWSPEPDTFAQVAVLMPVCAGAYHDKEQLDRALLGMFLSFGVEPLISELPDLAIEVPSKRSGEIVTENWRLRVLYPLEGSESIPECADAWDNINEVIRNLTKSREPHAFGAEHAQTKGQGFAVDKRNRVWFDPVNLCMFGYNKNFFRRIEQWHHKIRRYLVMEYSQILANPATAPAEWQQVVSQFHNSKFNWPSRLREELKHYLYV